MLVVGILPSQDLQIKFLFFTLFVSEHEPAIILGKLMHWCDMDQ